MTGKPHLLRPRPPATLDSPAPTPGVAPEQLDYLFEAAAAPAPTPARALGALLAQSRLSGWGDEAVRASLARQLCRLLPDLPPDDHDTVATVALRALEQLARDHVTFVRAALATAIKDIACAPPPVVQRLARDVERSVAEPILHCCATLTDSDLLTVIAGQPAPWALSAIAGRTSVSAPVSAAIVEAGDAEATGVLLDNTGAVIPEPALERAVEDAARHRALQGKLAARPLLPPRLALRLADFVDRSVIAVLSSRADFDDTTVAEIAAAVRRRVEWIERAPSETPERRALRLHRTGALDETAIGDALSWNEVGFVRAALALRAGAPAPVVDLVLDSGNPRAITALVWRAGFSMRCAMQVQARAAGIPPHAMLNARQGTGFPLPPAEMARQLALYGLN